MGSIVGKTTDFLGLTDHKGAAQAQASADKAAGEALAITREELAFQREQYYDWKYIYGTMQEQEAAYVENYTGADVVAKQLQQASGEYQKAESDITKALAQRGMSTSGLEAASLTQLYAQEAMQKAGIRSSQDDIASQKRMQFLGLGLGQGTQMLGTNAQVAQAGISGQTNLAGTFQNAATKQQVSNQGFLQEVSGVGTGYMLSDVRLKNNLTLIRVVDDYNVYRWEWNDTASKLGHKGYGQGVIAQEVLLVNPEAVGRNKDGYYYIKVDKLPKDVQREIK